MSNAITTTPITIAPLTNDYCQRIVDLILPIQQIEFNVPVTLEGQRDLLDIETHYIRPGGGFWGAIQEGELIGTIALMDTGHCAGALRKMFVKKEFRGKELGIAQRLLAILIEYCNGKGITDIYLGTVDMLKAAHRFYERNGFQRIEVEGLPSYFPRMMADNVFYHLHLN
ncbi:MAG TPA: GNAT family N-acetyltransferase [Puia sp.]|nr:GNAT family N-acetyltransferase [Puia sp.]